MLEGKAGVKLDFVFATREILKEHVLSRRTVCLVVVFMLNLFPDAINESNPRVIDDSRARKLANDLKRCAYYETCATYGLNVERVFQDGESEAEMTVWSFYRELFQLVRRSVLGGEGPADPPPPLTITTCPDSTPATWPVPPTPTDTPTRPSCLASQDPRTPRAPSLLLTFSLIRTLSERSVVSCRVLQFSETLRTLRESSLD